MPPKKHVRPDRAAAKIQELIDAGCSMRGIHEEAGIAQETLYRILRGQKQHIPRDFHDRILKLNPNKIRKTYRLSPVGSARRLRALGVQGFIVKDIAHKEGLPAATHISRIRQGLSTEITRTTHDAICAFYEKHKDEFGGSQLAATRVRTLGWRGPDFWADKDIDDPNVEENLPAHALVA